MARKSSTARPRPAAEQHEISVYDGQRRLGVIIGSGRSWRARNDNGRVIGRDLSRADALAAVIAAAEMLQS